MKNLAFHIITPTPPGLVGRFCRTGLQTGSVDRFDRPVLQNRPTFRMPLGQEAGGAGRRAVGGGDTDTRHPDELVAVEEQRKPRASPGGNGVLLEEVLERARGGALVQADALAAPARREAPAASRDAVPR